MNWTIGEDSFAFPRFLGEFLQIVTDANTDELRESKNFVHKLATRRKDSGNVHDGMWLMRCELLVGARGFEPPTSRSRNLQPDSAPVTL